jgi:hypothetical protein
VRDSHLSFGAPFAMYRDKTVGSTAMITVDSIKVVTGPDSLIFFVRNGAPGSGTEFEFAIPAR